MSDRERVRIAAEFAEEMAIELKKISSEMLRDPDNINKAYAMIYGWRTRFSQKVLHRLGYGLPRIRKEWKQ